MKRKGLFYKMSNNELKIRTMTIDDYDGVYNLWMTIKGFAIRSIDDSKVGVEKFLKRNLMFLTDSLNTLQIRMKAADLSSTVIRFFPLRISFLMILLCINI